MRKSYFLGAAGGPLGASLGLQARGRPSGAKQLPLTAPRGDVKLHSCPLFRALQASSASWGGPRCCGGCCCCCCPLFAGGAPDGWAHTRLDTNASVQNRLVRTTDRFANGCKAWLLVGGQHLLTDDRIVGCKCGEIMDAP